MKRPQSVAIIGGGPAGSALAILLAKRGIATVVFTHEKRPELVIGESLVPAVIPLLRELGVEHEVRSYSTLKPGATFSMRAEEEITFVFNNARRPAATYAYNTPRDRFDRTLLMQAKNVGAVVVPHPAKLRHAEYKVSLEPSSLDHFRKAIGTEPDLIVDATGRSRTIAKMLDLPFQTGQRSDRALFAHLDTAELSHAGHIHIDRLTRGWSWRIPLPGRVSVGFVVPEDYADSLGTSAEAQYDALLATEPVAKRFARTARRITSVMKYSNYQLVSERMHGANWVLLGDAAGFIDPIFSSGLLVGLTGARTLARQILSPKGSLAAYERATKRQLRSWHRIVNYFYDGRLFGMIRKGRLLQDRFPVNLIAPYVESHLGRILTGTAPDDRYSQGLMRAAMRIAIGDGRSLRLKIS